jgi:hypothetical protein
MTRTTELRDAIQGLQASCGGARAMSTAAHVGDCARLLTTEDDNGRV